MFKTMWMRETIRGKKQCLPLLPLFVVSWNITFYEAQEEPIKLRLWWCRRFFVACTWSRQRGYQHITHTCVCHWLVELSISISASALISVSLWMNFVWVCMIVPFIRVHLPCPFILSGLATDIKESFFSLQLHVTAEKTFQNWHQKGFLLRWRRKSRK